MGGRRGGTSKERERVALRGQEEEVPGGERAAGEAGGEEGVGSVGTTHAVREGGKGSGGRGEGDGEAKKGWTCRADSGMGEKTGTMTSRQERVIAERAGRGSSIVPCTDEGILWRPTVDERAEVGTRRG
ncbi:hypothetical protein EDB89DRAFT_1912874 [Lactarius sanguifluus]|nr:hypothetical protein EDB89DRAFT_1912874 [Lactarius sanguifluus]